MKRILKTMLLMVALLCATVTGAQNEKPEKGKFFLPKAGDIALGIDVTPLLNYFGNMFNNSTDNPYDSFGGEPVFDTPVNKPTVSIMGRYMITDRLAAQFNVGFLHQNRKVNVYQTDDQALMENPLSEQKIIDRMTLNSSGMAMALGVQYRRGYRRIQGYAGASLIYGFSKESDAYSYGNKITDINQTPTRTGYGNNIGYRRPDYWTQSYLLKHYNSKAIQHWGLGINVGVEVFIASCFSLGGEIYLNALWKDGAKEYARTEGYNPMTDKVEQRTELISPGNTEFNFGTQNLGGKLYLMFYF